MFSSFSAFRLPPSVCGQAFFFGSVVFLFFFVVCRTFQINGRGMGGEEEAEGTLYDSSAAVSLKQSRVCG
jgi:hypothetical protein